MFNQLFQISEHNRYFLYTNIALKNISFALISLNYIFNDNEFETNIYYDEHTFYFFHIQSVLTACGNLSNVFYNFGGFNGKEVTIRCQQLRSLFDISKSNFPLIFQKEVRNTNEHFDERYEQFHGNIGDYNILSRDTDINERNIILNTPHLRTYDKETGIYYSYNRKKEAVEYNLHQLDVELNEMRRRITNNHIYDAKKINDNLNERPIKQI